MKQSTTVMANQMISIILLTVLATPKPLIAKDLNFDIEIAFNHKPPLFFVENNKAIGSIVEIAKLACEQAKLKCKFTELPFQRVMFYLEQKEPNFAALGFSKTPEREKVINFSEPIWKDSESTLLIRSEDKKKFMAHKTLHDLVQNSTYTFGGKIGNFYPIDYELSQLGNRDIRFSIETSKIPFLLTKKRFDFTFMFKDEVMSSIKESNISLNDVTTITYPDMPNGNYRYILFSKSVSMETIKKFDDALIHLRKNKLISTLR